MEIGRYLRSRPWSAAIALLLPLLAGLTAFGLLQGTPSTNIATANVRVPESVGGSASIGIFAADFALAAEQDEVLQPVSDEAGVSVGRLRNNLDVERLGQSSRLTVSYTDRNPARAEQVLRLFIRRALVDLTTSDTAAANAKSALAARDKALAAQRAFEADFGLDPRREYGQLSDNVRDLQAAGAPPSQIAAAVAARDRLVEPVRQYTALTNAADAAENVLEDAQQAANESAAAGRAATNPRTIENLEVSEVSQTPRIVQGVAVAAVLGLLVGLAVLVLPDLLRGGRRRPPPALEDTSATRRVA